MEGRDVVSNTINRFKKARFDLCKRVVKFMLRNAQFGGGKLRAVDSSRIIEERGQALFVDVGANFLNDLLRRKRRAKDFNRALFSRFADDIALEAEFLTQSVDFRLDVVFSRVDPFNLERVLIHRNQILF